MSNKGSIGQPLSRLEGELKVTGDARYAGDYPAPDLLYGYVVNSVVTKGFIKEIDASRALAVPGVEAVFSHENRPSLAWFDFKYADMDAPPGSVFKPLHDHKILYNGQPIALVVADTFETARYAATLVEITFEEETFSTSLAENIEKARDPKTGLATLLKPPPPKPQGDFEEAYSEAAGKTEGFFEHGTEHHNPMELFATTTVYEGKGRLTIYDKTQGTVNSQLYVCNVFGLKFKNVRVVSPNVGGAFGSGLRPQYQLFLSVMAALELKRSVRVVLSRKQMFTFGHRPPTLQKTRFGADADGRLTAIGHRAVGETSQFEDYIENVVNWSAMLYPAENTRLEYQIVPVDVFSPLDMRAPGGSTGMHAIECTLDQLAYELDMDPVQLRLANYTTIDPSKKKPYTSKELKACYEQGAERFRWHLRNPEPRSMRRGSKLVGYGMATGIWEANQLVARAEAAWGADGLLRINSAVTDIGTGTKTVLAQIAADELGLPVEQVIVDYGDSKMPFAPIQGGSFTIATVGTAVQAACGALRKKLLKLAGKVPNSPFAGVKIGAVGFVDGMMVLKDDPSQSMSIATILSHSGEKEIRTVNTGLPSMFKTKNYARAAHSAAFVEVEVDEELGIIQVKRALTTVAAGRIINPKTARSQILGGMVWGISKALMEETVQDHRLGKYMNPNLAEYHIPVHADTHELDVVFVDERDDLINGLGVKGVGEIGLVAMTPAITNAIFHATGKRINKLPVRLDALL